MCLTSEEVARLAQPAVAEFEAFEIGQEGQPFNRVRIRRLRADADGCKPVEVARDYAVMRWQSLLNEGEDVADEGMTVGVRELGSRSADFEVFKFSARTWVGAELAE